MSYRIHAITTDHEAEAMAAPDSLEAIANRIKRMVKAGRGMVLAVREFTYLGDPPVLHAGLRLDTGAHDGGFSVADSGDQVHCSVRFTNGSGGFYDSCWFGFNERTYEYSGNETEAAAWKRYKTSPDGGDDRLARRRNMTHVSFVGGLPGYRWQHPDRIVITDWNDDGVATEKTLGFEPGEGSW